MLRRRKCKDLAGNYLRSALLVHWSSKGVDRVAILEKLVRVPKVYLQVKYHLSDSDCAKLPVMQR